MYSMLLFGGYAPQKKAMCDQLCENPSCLHILHVYESSCKFLIHQVFDCFTLKCSWIICPLICKFSCCYWKHCKSFEILNLHTNIEGFHRASHIYSGSNFRWMKFLVITDSYADYALPLSHWLY